MEAQQQELEQIQRAIGLVWGVLLGVCMQLRALELSRLGILGEQVEGVEELQRGAAVLTSGALAGFWEMARQGDDPCGELMSVVTLVIGLIRLGRLLSD